MIYAATQTHPQRVLVLALMCLNSSCVTVKPLAGVIKWLAGRSNPCSEETS